MAVTLKKQRKLTNREKANGIEPIIAEKINEPVWLGEYRDFFTYEWKPVTKAFIEKLGQDLLDWTDSNPGALRICEFFDNKRISKSTYDLWREKFPEFEDAFEAAKRRIGRRRERGGMLVEGDLREGFAYKTMRQFMNEFKQDEIEQAALKKEEKDTEGTKYIVFEKVPETDVVKRRKVENE